MAEVWQGTLRKEFGKSGGEAKLSLHGPTKKRDKSQNHPVRRGRLSRELEQSREKEIAVAYEFDENGLVCRVRRQGQEWEEPAAAPPHPGRDRAEQQSGHIAHGHFFNPYNFIPALPTEELQGDRDTHPLGRFAPVGHDRWRAGYYSGAIDIEITAETPLVIPDTSQVDINPETGHNTLPPLLDREGRPLLRPTALKGCIRAAYEAVTNSRFGVFQGHDVKLARRMDAREGLSMVPARISENGTDLELFLGPHAAKGKKDGYPRYDQKRRLWQPGGTSEMYAAWLPRYVAGNQHNLSGPELSPWRRKYSTGEPEHRHEVRVWVRRIEYRDRQSFDYWRVEHIQPASSTVPLPPKLSFEKPPYLDSRGSHNPLAGSLMEGRGYVCITGQNIGRKHDERVFFVPVGQSIVTEPLDKTWLTEWKHRVEDYRAKAKRVLDQRRGKRPPISPAAYLGIKPGETGFSRHVYESGAETLKPGDLCYARFNHAQEIIGLYPVMIARELGEAAPEKFLPDDLKPAQSRNEMSPADRVFGWVNQAKPDSGSVGKKGTWRGQLRIESVRCETPAVEAVTLFRERSLPLAILSTPKPEQARFYLAQDRLGTPLAEGASRDEPAYKQASERGLRGRKVYPHHATLPEGYWTNPLAAQHMTEYKRVGAADALRDDQNRSIGGWVNVGTKFAARIAVTNLSSAELGALLWLINLKPGHFHRIGGGKPLGFGSVRMAITALDLDKGEAVRARYGALRPAKRQDAGDAPLPPLEGAVRGPIQAFVAAVESAYGAPFEEVRFIKAFLNAAEGFNKVHYPRATAEPTAADENYKWFVENSRQARPLALDSLWDPKGLPLLGGERERRGGGR